MKQIIYLILLFITSITSAIAGNGYCDGRPTAQDVANCYRSNIQMENSQRLTMYKKYINYPGFSQAERQKIQNKEKEWEHAVDSQCRTDVCVYDSVRDRKMEYNTAYYKLTHK